MVCRTHTPAVAFLRCGHIIRRAVCARRRGGLGGAHFIDATRVWARAEGGPTPRACPESSTIWMGAELCSPSGSSCTTGWSGIRCFRVIGRMWP